MCHFAAMVEATGTIAMVEAMERTAITTTATRGPEEAMTRRHIEGGGGWRLRRLPMEAGTTRMEEGVRDVKGGGKDTLLRQRKREGNCYSK